LQKLQYLFKYLNAIKSNEKYLNTNKIFLGVVRK